MVEPHKHCPVCGSPIPMKERVCSADCQKVLEQQQKNIKKKQNDVICCHCNIHSRMGIFHVPKISNH